MGIVFACVLVLVVLTVAGCSGNGSAAAPTTTAASEAGGSTAVAETTVSSAGSGAAASSAAGAQTLLMFAGAASKPATEEAIQVFEQKTGIKIEATFGGSGKVLSQMKLVKEGDLYFPGSSDYMEKAKEEGDVIASTEEIIVYLVPAINVETGNPKNIQGLKDLLRADVKVAIANPENVCVGAYAVEIVEAVTSGFTDEEKAAFKAHLLNYTESCEKTATAISLDQVDAVIGWSVFQDWDPENIQTIALPAEQIPRVGYIPIAVASYTKNQAAAQQFVDFLKSEEGMAIFAKYGYFTTPEQAFAYIGEEKPVGGEYTVPAGWVTK